jgi:predicted small secreted protein
MATPHRPRFSRAALPLTVAAAAATLAACDRDTRDWAGSDVKVCRDAQGRRVADRQCEQQTAYAGHNSGHVPGVVRYYLGRGSQVARVGEPLTGGSPVARPGVSYARATPATVTRGGFGSSARSFGGGHGGGE